MAGEGHLGSFPNSESTSVANPAGLFLGGHLNRCPIPTDSNSGSTSVTKYFFWGHLVISPPNPPADLLLNWEKGLA